MQRGIEGCGLIKIDK
ncbi:hypothetical protein YPPY34_1605, partial [Yersinia pestis PY-34]